jgi:uncharacterized OB-fold protein/acyl dehydratase
MTPEETSLFEAKIQAFVGRAVSAPRPGPDDVNSTMIRHFCEMIGDENPVYTDSGFAAQSSKGGIVAPPAMMQVWSMEGYAMYRQARQDLQRQLHEVFDQHGFTGVLGTNTTADYMRDLRPGDQVTTHCVIDSISEQKATARGIGYFIETRTTFTDQHQQTVGTLVFRVLKYLPNELDTADSATVPDNAASVPTRIASPRGHDNKWWWEAIDNGVLLIQRCKDCAALRHPPRPMCGECQSIQWDAIESSLEGEVYSFTQIHYPRFPGYPSPLVTAVIALAEGTRLVSNVVGCEPEAVHIGMKVKGIIEQVDEKTILPQFYPAD